MAGTRPGRADREQVTLYKSVGVAVQDAAAAALVLAAAREQRRRARGRDLTGELPARRAFTGEWCPRRRSRSRAQAVAVWRCAGARRPARALLLPRCRSRSHVRDALRARPGLARTGRPGARRRARRSALAGALAARRGRGAGGSRGGGGAAAAAALGFGRMPAMAEPQRNRLAVALDPRVPIYRDTYNEYFVLVLSAGGAAAGTQVPLYLLMAITGIWSVGDLRRRLRGLRARGDLRPGPAADAAARARWLGGALGRNDGDHGAGVLLPGRPTDALIVAWCRLASGAGMTSSG